MKDRRWERIKTIVDNALTLSGRERKTYLSTACRENPEICAEIGELLYAIEESEEQQFMQLIRKDREDLIAELSDELNKSFSGEEFIGTTIGSYRITDQLGSGGMGIVFKAERTDTEFHHQVAIKLMKKGVDLKENIRRFKLEREILANLQHPNIAQLFDGGVTNDGIPYLIMEYIDGIPIDRYCNEHRLTIDQRLNLFKKICSAVQYAHNKLVVHRDLKAQNIYVNSEGTVKVLDFGVAKLLDPKLTEVTLLKTHPGQKLWTPQYAAPEQVWGQEITAKTDIYALGVLLHKLLTDTYPLDMEGKSLGEIEGIIKDSSPSSPSQSLADHSSKKECATYRKTGVEELTKKLRGDLDALVLKAIRKEPEYRYTSVSQLLEDVERYRSNTPLVARNGTWKYRTSKFIRRNKAGLAAAVLFLIAAIGFAGFYTWRISQERDRAEVQAQKAEQVTEFMMGLFESNDPNETLGSTVTARQLLEEGVEQIDELTSQPEVQAQMLDVVGRVYQNLGEYERAQSLLEQALSIRKTLYEEPHEEVAKSLSSLGVLFRRQGKYDEAEVLHRKALTIRHKLFGKKHENVAESLNNLAAVQHRQGNSEAAESLYREALAIRRELLGEKHKDIAITLNNLGTLFREKGNYQAAEPLLRESLSMRREIFGEKHTKVAISLGNLALLFRNMGEYERAEVLFRKTLELWRELVGEEHPEVATALNDLGVILLNKEKLNEAEPLLRKALSIRYKVLGAEHPKVAQSLNNLAGLLLEKRAFAEAESRYREALALRRKLLGEKHRLVAFTLHNLAKLLYTKEDYKGAEPLYREAIGILESTLGNTHWLAAYFKSNLGACLTSLASYEKAESLLIHSFQFLEKHRGSDDHYTQKALEQLITLYEEWDKPERARIYRKELALVAKNSE